MCLGTIRIILWAKITKTNMIKYISIKLFFKIRKMYDYQKIIR